jgi:hypothetical protein
MHVEEKDYLSILAGLGQECLGSIKVIDESTLEIQPEYRKLTNDQVRKLACLLHNGITQSCKVKTDIIASPFWTKLQSLVIRSSGMMQHLSDSHQVLSYKKIHCRHLKKPLTLSLL